MNHMSGNGILNLWAFKVAAAGRACGDTYIRAVPVAVQWGISPHLCFVGGYKMLHSFHALEEPERARC